MIPCMSESTAPRPEKSPPPADGAGPATQRKRLPVWLLRTIVAVVAIVVLVLAYYIASVTVPLAWATSVRDQTGGKLGNAIPLGMFYGFVFSFVPVTVAWQARRRRLNKWVRVVVLVVAVLLTLPNLLTLAVLYGTTASAVDARSIWTTGGANWFGTWSQIFMVAGVVCAVAVIFLSRAWIRRGRKIRQIKAAERLVRDNERAKARDADRARRAAGKKARADARAAGRRTKGAARPGRDTPPAGAPQAPTTPDGSATPPPGTPEA